MSRARDHLNRRSTYLRYRRAVQPTTPKAGIATAASRAHTFWILGVTVAIAAALVGMFAWMSWSSYWIVVNDTDDLSSNLALSVEQFVARTIETVDLSLQAVADETETARPRARADLEVLLGERLSRAPQLTGLAVYGSDGRLRAGTAAFLAPGTHLADAAYLRTTSDGGLRVVLTEGKQIVIGRRFKRGDGSAAGVVAATLNGDYLQQFFFTLRTGEDGIIALATEDGTLLARKPFVPSLIGQNFGGDALFQQWLPIASSGVFPMRSQGDGRWRIVGYQRVEKLPLVVEVALSRDEALAHWHSRALLQGGVAAVLLLLLGVGAMMLHRELGARLQAHAQLRDTVSELERAHRVAAEASRVKSEFMAHMSHELRTPLNAIIGFSEAIRDAVMGPVSARYRDYARDIHSSGSHLLSLIKDILDLSKVEAGRLELRDEIVDLATLVEDCRRFFAERAATGGLKLRVRVAPNLPRLRGDEIRLKQILLNLLSNAVKFTAPGGRITLEAAKSAEGGVALAVGDTGIGMAPEEVPLALEPFRQLDAAFNRRFDGTGLGLPLARQLAELHGGTLTIDSAKDRGTTVTVTLPASRVVDPTVVPFASGVVS
jgi:two-component system, cell cycle sensor histidine kinase PleC